MFLPLLWRLSTRVQISELEILERYMRRFDFPSFKASKLEAAKSESFADQRRRGPRIHPRGRCSICISGILSVVSAPSAVMLSVAEHHVSA